MTSQRNERILARRKALLDQQRIERQAFDAFGKNLEAEEAARLATARTVARVVDTSGQARTMEILGLTKAEVAEYVRLRDEADAASDQEAPSDASSEKGGGDSSPESADDTAAASGGIPGQTSESETEPAGAGV